MASLSINLSIREMRLRELAGSRLPHQQGLQKRLPFIQLSSRTKWKKQVLSEQVIAYPQVRDGLGSAYLFVKVKTVVDKFIHFFFGQLFFCLFKIFASLIIA